MKRRRQHHREVNYLARSIFGNRIKGAAQLDIAKDSVIYAKGPARNPLEASTKRCIRGEHRPDRIITAHTFIDKVSVIHTLDKRPRQTVVAHVTGPLRNSLVDGGIGLFFGEPHFVRNSPCESGIAIAKSCVQFTRPGMFFGRFLQVAVFVLKKMSKFDILEMNFRGLDPPYLPQRIDPVVKSFLARFKIGIATMANIPDFNSLAYIPGVPLKQSSHLAPYRKFRVI